MAKSTKKTIQEIIKAFKEASDAINSLNKSLDKTLKDSSKEMKQYQNNVEDIRDAFNDLADGVKKLGVEKGLSLKHVHDYEKKISDLEKELKNLEKTARRATNEEEFKKVKAEAAQLRKEIEKTTKEIEEMGVSASAILMDMGGGIKQFGNLWGAMKSGPGAIQGWSKSALDFSDKMKVWPGKLANAGKAMKMFGAGTAKVGKLLGGVASKIGGIGAIILYAAKKFIDFQIAADRFVKNANKAFAMVRGPDIMTKDIRKQFKEFNDQIYSAGENLAVGLDVDQIRTFMNAVYQAGQNITMLNAGMLTYRKTIEIAAKASKTMAMDLDAVGAAIGELMTDFRMDLNQIDKAFIQVTFDAQKSGLSTDRFWGAVKNASASLAFYGIYVEQASKMMAKFIETSVMGADETAKTTEDITQSFKNMNREQQASFTALVRRTKGGDKMVKAAFKSIEEEWRTKAEDLQTDLKFAIARGDTKEINRLRNELAAANEKMLKAQEAQTKTDVQLAPYLPMLSGRATELIGQLIRTNAGVQSLADLDDENIWVAEKILEKMGINTDIAWHLARMSDQQNRSMELVLGINEEGKILSNSILANLKILSQLTETQENDIKDSFGELITAASAEYKNIEEIAKEQSDLVKTLVETKKIDESTAEGIAEMVAVSPTLGKKIMDMIISAESIGDEEIEELKNIFKESRIGDRLIEQANMVQRKAREEAEAQRDEAFKGLLDQTLSFEDQAKIIKDQGEYWLMSNKLSAAINGTAQNILNLLTKQFPKAGKIAQKENVALIKGLKAATALRWKGFGIRKEEFDPSSIVAQLKESYGVIEAGKKKTDEQTKLLAEIPGALKDANKFQELMVKNQHILGDDLPQKVEEREEYLKNLINADEETRATLLAKLEDDTREQMKKENIKIEQAKEVVKYLTDLDNKNKRMAKYLELMMKGDPKAIKQLGSDIASMYNEGISVKEVGEITGFTPEEQARYLKKAGKKEAATIAGLEVGKAYEEIPDIELQVEQELPRDFQGLAEPFTVPSASMKINLHRGETIMPAPGAGGRGPGAGAPPGAAPTFNITAVAKDLVTAREVGQIVVNQIRASRYAEQLTGMA